MKISLEKINEMVSEFVFAHLYENGQPNFKKLDYTRNLLRILLENIPNIAEHEYEKHVPIKDSIEYALVFLGSIDDSYGEYLHQRIVDGTVNFYSSEYAYEHDIPLTSFSSYEDDKRIVSVVYDEVFGDVYAIIHEILHDMNLIIDLEDYRYDIYTRDMFTETISFLGTTLATEYYKETFKNKKEFGYDVADEYYGLYEKVMQIDFVVKLVDFYLNNGCITEEDIINTLEGRSSFYKNSVAYYFENIDEVVDLDIYYNERYLTAVLLTQYILNTNKTYEDKVKVLKDLNEMIMSCSIEQIFEYLDLDYIIEDDMFMNLTTNSLEKIETSYKLGTKKL